LELQAGKIQPSDSDVTPVDSPVASSTDDTERNDGGDDTAAPRETAKSEPSARESVDDEKVRETGVDQTRTDVRQVPYIVIGLHDIQVVVRSKADLIRLSSGLTPRIPLTVTIHT